MKITYYENFSQKPKELIESKHTFIVVLQVYVTIGALEKALLTALLRMPLTTRWLRISPRFSNRLIGFRFEVYGCSSEKQLFSFEGKTSIDSSNKGAWNGKKYASRRIFVQFLRSRSLIFFFRLKRCLGVSIPIFKASKFSGSQKVCFVFSQSWIYHSLPLYEALIR